MLSNDFFFPFEIGLIVFALCTGLAIIASGALPKWLGWVMVVIGVVAFTPVGLLRVLRGAALVGDRRDPDLSPHRTHRSGDRVGQTRRPGAA